MTNKEIGAILAALRKKAGLSRQAVAEFIDKSDKTIAHWETGYTAVDANMLFTLCKLYNTDVDSAFGFHRERDLDAEILNAFHLADEKIQGIVLNALDIPVPPRKNEQVS